MYAEQNSETEASLNGSTNANETNKENSTLITHHQVGNSPLTITGNDEAGYFIRMGDYRLTEYQPTIEEAENLLYTDDWRIIANMISIMITINAKLEPINNNQKTN